MTFAFWLFLPLNFISGKDHQWLTSIDIAMEKSIRKHECVCIYFGWNNIHVNCRPQASELGSNTKNKEAKLPPGQKGVWINTRILLLRFSMAWWCCENPGRKWIWGINVLVLCDGNVWETLQLPWLFEAWIWKELSHTDPEGETSLPGQGTALTWRAMAAGTAVGRWWLSKEKAGHWGKNKANQDGKMVKGREVLSERWAAVSLCATRGCGEFIWGRSAQCGSYC